MYLDTLRFFPSFIHLPYLNLEPLKLNLLLGYGISILIRTITDMTLHASCPYPLGATLDSGGCNFALFSRNATAVELCLFANVDDAREERRISLDKRSGDIWHVYVPYIREGQLYAYRVHGNFDPYNGHFFNPCKTLLDPYAKVVARKSRWHTCLQSCYYEGETLVTSVEESGEHGPLGMVAGELEKPKVASPGIPLEDTVLYEVQVKGATIMHPKVPERLRGTYLGLCSQPMIEHFKYLGITSVELLPVHCGVSEPHLVERGLTNYWGYNTLSYFAPDPRFASKKDPLAARREFRQMVDTFHKHGIEVILDVVYNHSCEGGVTGPTVSWRGIDNASYYRINDAAKQHYVDVTGCGNTLYTSHAPVLQMVTDSLRYWVEEMGVDGFRFDLACSLGRGMDHVFSPHAALLSAISQDPILSQVKLFAEPWDVGMGGYQLGHFPALWTEWNGNYRDTMRSFWKGDEGARAGFATRFSGSSDIFYGPSRGPLAGINFVTCHDGFTLRDLVSYNHKHNEANGEDNRDGSSHNISWNCGVEGPTRQRRILALRRRQQKNMILTMFLSRGIPMLLGGDELSRTQWGNNNGYCQDNEDFWLPWDLNKDDEEFYDFVAAVSAFRASNPVLKKNEFFGGKVCTACDTKDIFWSSYQGKEITGSQWNDTSERSLAVVMQNWGACEFSSGKKNVDTTSSSCPRLLFLCNTSHRPRVFVLPRNTEWQLVFDTSKPYKKDQSPFFLDKPRMRLVPWSSAVLVEKGKD